jgi:O-6-methylguanine DNA methyltransferase
MKGSVIRSVEFFEMAVHPADGAANNYLGAVVFGEEKDGACSVLRVLTPRPTAAELHQDLSLLHGKVLKSQLLLKQWQKHALIQALHEFCQQGFPLPSLFEKEFAEFAGLSAFQLDCYAVACRIPHGETRSYSWLATALKKPGAERAVGQAMKTNPFPLLVPCHRIVKKDGHLGGYMGTASQESWQISLKKQILARESLYRQPSLFDLFSPAAVARSHVLQ